MGEDFLTRAEFEAFLKELQSTLKEVEDTMREIVDGNQKLERMVAEALEQFFKVMGIPEQKKGRFVV